MRQCMLQIHNLKITSKMASRVRIDEEFDRLIETPPDFCSVDIENDSPPYNLSALIWGPTKTPYENGTFKLRIVLDSKYPDSQPQVRFATQIYHPNISTDGRVCVDYLNSWNNKKTLSELLAIIVSFLDDPNPDSCLNHNAGALYKKNRFAYDNTVKQWVIDHASS